MTVETATYIADLVVSNPAGTDQQSEGDDHLRLLKNVLKNTFPNLTGPANFSKFSSVSSDQNPGVNDLGTTYIVDDSSVAVTVTLPNTTSVVINPGYEIRILKNSDSANTVTFALQGSDIMLGGGDNAVKFPFQEASAIYLGSHVWKFKLNSKLGEVTDYLGSVAPSGALLLDGSTIGNAGSAATHNAAAYHALYILLWRSMADTEAPVTGGRGGSAGADWSGNKPIKLPDLRGRAIFGKDDMGGSAANRITALGSGVAGTTLGKSGGEEVHTLVTSETPTHNHTVHLTDPGHSHTYVGVPIVGNFAGGSNAIQSHSGNLTTSPATTGIGVTLDPVGADGAHNNLPPAYVLNKIVWIF